VSNAAEPWSLTSLREKLIKIGAKVVSHSRYVTFQLAEVAVSRQMFADILLLIARLGRHLHQHEKPAEANAGGDERKGMPRCGRSGARQRFSAVNHRLRLPLARDEGDLLLPKPVKRAFWPQNRRESGECRLKCIIGSGGSAQPAASTAVSPAGSSAFRYHAAAFRSLISSPIG